MLCKWAKRQQKGKDKWGTGKQGKGKRMRKGKGNAKRKEKETVKRQGKANGKGKGKWKGTEIGKGTGKEKVLKGKRQGNDVKHIIRTKNLSVCRFSIRVLLEMSHVCIMLSDCPFQKSAQRRKRKYYKIKLLNPIKNGGLIKQRLNKSCDLRDRTLRLAFSSPHCFFCVFSLSLSIPRFQQHKVGKERVLQGKRKGNVKQIFRTTKLNACRCSIKVLLNMFYYCIILNDCPFQKNAQRKKEVLQDKFLKIP